MVRNTTLCEAPAWREEWVHWGGPHKGPQTAGARGGVEAAVRILSHRPWLGFWPYSREQRILGGFKHEEEVLRTALSKDGSSDW